VVFKGWFKGKGDEGGEAEVTIEDLIVLERYGEAAERLRAKLKANPDDLHSHLKLADVYTALRQLDSAVDEYVHAAEEYARDGFYDKGIALLARAQKLMPADESLRLKIHSYAQVKGLEHKRAAAVGGLRQGRAGASDSGAFVLQIQRLWHQLASSTVVQRLAADQITRLFAAFEILPAEAGTVLAREGEGRAELFLVVSGVVEAGIDDAGAAGATVRSFTARDILGERALLERQPWPATLRVTEAALLLKLDRAGLERALVGNPDPRGLLDVLRDQGHDREVEAVVRRLKARS
jgi:hypothetical protein